MEVVGGDDADDFGAGVSSRVGPDWVSVGVVTSVFVVAGDAEPAAAGVPELTAD